MVKIALLIAFILITSVIQAWVDGLLNVETSGLLAHRIISQLFVLFTGAGILAIINLKGI